MRFTPFIGIAFVLASVPAFALSKHCSVQIDATTRHSLDWTDETDDKDGVLTAKELFFRGQDSPEEVGANLKEYSSLVWAPRLFRLSSKDKASLEVTIKNAETGEAIVSVSVPNSPFQYKNALAYCSNGV